MYATPWHPEELLTYAAFLSEYFALKHLHRSPLDLNRISAQLCEKIISQAMGPASSLSTSWASGRQDLHKGRIHMYMKKSSSRCKVETLNKRDCANILNFQKCYMFF